MIAPETDYLYFGFRRFQTAFWISICCVAVQFLIFLVPGIFNRRWEGEMGFYFVALAVIIFCGIIACGGIIWIFGFRVLRFISQLIYLLLARNRVVFVDWERSFCRSLWPLPWAFGIGGIIYMLYFALGWGGSPDDVIVGTIGNFLGAFCYITIFYNWFRLFQHSKNKETEQDADGDAEEVV
jgi:hypothetical protein